MSLRQDYLDLGPQEALPEPELTPEQEAAAEQVVRRTGPRRSDGLESCRRRAGGAGREAAVKFARIALTDAALAVLQARLARIDAGEDDPDAATVDGHVPLHGRNPVSRHGPALAHGLTGEIKYILARKPRNTMKSLAIALAMGLLYLGFIRIFEWDTDQKWLPYLGLWAIGVVMGGSVCVNAMSFDAMRVRAALDSGERLWHLLVIKNLALLCLVAPLGFMLCALLAWRAGDIYAFYKGCALMVCMILLWLGVGNVLSIVLPSRDEPIKQRRQSGSLKQFIIAFVVAYFIGYLVNAMLVWRVFAAQELTQRLGNALLPVADHHRLQRLHVDPADDRRGRVVAEPEGAPGHAEGDHRLQGQRGDEGVRGRGRSRKRRPGTRRASSRPRPAPRSRVAVHGLR